MGANRDREAQKRDEEQKRGSGMRGGGQGRTDVVGGSGVHPASGQSAPEDAEAQGMASLGQGGRGAAGYEDHGGSELTSITGEKAIGGMTAGSSGEPTEETPDLPTERRPEK
ncbi:MAG: hypothetical protein M5U01_35540 [Ardenticatenaceae bacterium]|nr:hypothetical protein [Ardenticatenaceae bacterium]HBY95396.1 hypothetical protein [Chloroflexota bacterium]